jgi:hypothetical protein
MFVSAGNLDALVGFSFGAAEFVGVTVASYAQGPDGSVIDLLTQVLGVAAAPDPPGNPSSYLVTGVVDGADQIIVNAYATTNGGSTFLQALTYNVIGYEAQALLVSSMTLPALLAALQAGQSIAGQIGAIAAWAVTDGAYVLFNPGAAFAGPVACFALGTRIHAGRGEVAVEDVRIGDRLPGQVSGRMRRVCWVGRRTVDVENHPRPWDVAPVRVRVGALAPGRPHRDVLLSPDHAVLVAGSLIPVRYLINGATIAQEFCASITYLHVELDRHDVLLADGLPCESFLDTGNRAGLVGARGAARGPRSWRPPARVLAASRLLQHGEPR